jgi:hypothetical protein
MNKEQWLQKIMTAFSDAANLKSEAQLLGNDYTEEYSPYLKGQRVIIEIHGNKTYGIIEGVSFDQHSTLQGMAALTVIPYTKNWGKAITSRNYLRVTGMENQKVIYCNFDPLKQ